MSERGWRVASPTAFSIARVTSAITYPPCGPRAVSQPGAIVPFPSAPMAISSSKPMKSAIMASLAAVLALPASAAAESVREVYGDLAERDLKRGGSGSRARRPAGGQSRPAR